MRKTTRMPTHGIMAEFDNPSDVVAAANRAYEDGYRRMDAYSPYPIEALSEAIGVHRTNMPPIVLTGGIIGGLSGYLMQYYLLVINYPLNVGGKPFHSWPMFIPITFECAVLGAALAAVFGMLALNGLPEPYHPVFNTPNFALASRDRFFLLIQSDDPKFDREATNRFLKSLGAREVNDVEH